MVFSASSKTTALDEWVEPLVTDATDYHQDSLRQWTSDLVAWHSGGSPSTTRTQSGRRVTKSRLKRKASDVDRPSARLRRRYRPSVELLEASEATAGFAAGRSETQATIELVALLAGGRSASARRARKRKIGDMEDKRRQSTSSWIDYYERLVPRPYGDLREVPLAMVEELDGLESPVDVWNAVLGAAEDMEQELAEDKASMPLSEALAFIANACRLPTPERVFNETTVPLQIATQMWALLDMIDVSRAQQAKLMDLWREEGVELDVLRKQLDTASKLKLKLDYAKDMKRQVQVVVEWQARLDAALAVEDLDDGADDEERNDLAVLEELALEAKSHGFRSKGLLVMESKIEKAYQLRDRIIDWRTSSERGARETIKFVASIVRDLNRLKLRFPEAYEMLAFHRAAESWVDRANIAIRSRISLNELVALIKRGQEMPLDLSDFQDKLQMRERMANEWIASFKEHVPCPLKVNGEIDYLAWMQKVREEIGEGGHTMLHELAAEGSRIPVEVDCVKLLQVELDGRSWTAKARKWIRTGEIDDDSRKRGKLEDLQDHMEKAVSLRERLELSVEDQQAWVLECESDLRAIVDSAEDWYDRYGDVLEGDSKRNKRASLSIADLRRIVQEADAIYANLGSTSSKLARILAQAEEWYAAYSPLLVRCNLEGDRTSREIVDVSEITAAVDASKSDLSLDLVEAVKLENLAESIEEWFEDANSIIGNKRQRRNKKVLFSLERINELISEADSLCVDTVATKRQLQEQLECVRQWQARVEEDLERVLVGSEFLREAINETYGSPAEFTRAKACGESKKSAIESSEGDTSMEIDDDKKASEAMPCDVSSLATSEHDSHLHFGSSEYNVHGLIRKLQTETQAMNIDTPEGKAASKLEAFSRWCLQSLKYLDSQRDVFDKRFFGAFDRFLAEGRDLAHCADGGKADSEGLLERVRMEWVKIVSEQLERLNVVSAERERYIAWCDQANRLFSEEKRVAIEKLRDLKESSIDFPPSCDVIRKVIALESKANDWIKKSTALLNSEEKMTLQEAKSMLDEGEKIGFVSKELKLLRNGLKAARGWANRVKRCKSDTKVDDVQALLDEHDSLIVDMPDEVAKLRQASRNYCICRRPYEGFMIGCDSCDEWYHGPCIGVTESKAGRVDKYVCIRCSLARTFEASASTIVSVIRKWTSAKDRRRARQIDAQRHQRKARKETKELTTLKEEQELIRAQLVDTEKNVPAVVEQDAALDAVNKDGSKLVSNPAGDDTVGITGAVSASVSSSIADETTQNKDDNVTFSSAPNESQSRTALEARLSTIEESITQCLARLANLEQAVIARRNIEELEDAKSSSLRSWCLKVRSQALIPRTTNQIADSRPLPDGGMSRAMTALVDEADMLDILDVNDVKEVINAFKGLGWTLRARNVFSRHPTDDDLEGLVSSAASLKLPDEKALRLIKSISQRASSWKSRVSKALCPVPGEAKPFDLDILRELVHAGDDIPVSMSLESRLLTVIEDKGGRHCLCGGPSDGRFMLSCDGCERWFHGHCVGVQKEDSEALDSWKCPPCAGANNASISPVNVAKFHGLFDAELESGDDDSVSCVSSDTAEKLWPPYGLLGSEKATDALGPECSVIPDFLESARQVSSVASSAAEEVQSEAEPSTVVSTTTTVGTTAASATEAREESDNSSQFQPTGFGGHNPFSVDGMPMMQGYGSPLPQNGMHHYLPFTSNHFVATFQGFPSSALMANGLGVRMQANVAAAERQTQPSCEPKPPANDGAALSSLAGYDSQPMDPVAKNLLVAPEESRNS